MVRHRDMNDARRRRDADVNEWLPLNRLAPRLLSVGF